MQFQAEAQVSGGSLVGNISFGKPLCSGPPGLPPAAGRAAALSGCPFGVPKGGAALPAPFLAIPLRCWASHGGMGHRSQLPSLCSSPCRAPGDEEAQAENLITSNGKVTVLRSLCHCPVSQPPPSTGQALQTPLLFSLQRRRHRKQRTEQEPCGESQARLGGVIGMGGTAGDMYGRDCGALSRPVGLGSSASLGWDGGKH